MKVFSVVGASALPDRELICDLIATFRIDGWSVSTIKRAPDGFDLDQPGKGSYAKREAGATDVMLVGDRRLVLMHEFRESSEPSVESLLARMSPVDVVLVEGFKDAALPTVEVWLRSSGRPPRWPTNPHVFAIVSDEPIDSTIARFSLRDVAELASHVAERLGLRDSRSEI